MNRNRASQNNNPAHGQPVAAFPLRGRFYSLAEAGELALREQTLGNFQTAVDIYDFILSNIPHHATAHNNRGVALQKMERYGDAAASYRRAITLKPDYANAHYNLGSVLKLMKRFDEALAGFDRAIELKPDHAQACNSRGVILQELRRYEEAMASYDLAIAAKPDYAEAFNNRGTALVSQGNMTEAKSMFVRAFQLKPDFPDPLYNLANIRKYQRIDHPDVSIIHTVLSRPGIPAEDKEYLYFTLGKIYDDCESHEEAFEYYRQANEIRNAQAAYRPAEIERATDEIIEVFSQDFLTQPPVFASESDTFVFIVGMPRSGTTLLGNILSNHRAVAMAGELPTLPNLATGLSELVENRIPYPQATRKITPDLAAGVIRDYEKRLKRDVGLNVPHVIDKNPLNFKHLGFIARLFPKARIIHCTRNPLDTGLSNYFQRFPLHLSYSFDLRHIGHYYGECVRLMEHWHKIKILNLLEIRYEDLVLNTESAVRRMLDFVGLEWDERCLAPHTNPGTVESASQWQVRQPIYRRSVGRWRHYEKQLAPLIETLRARNISFEV